MKHQITLLLTIITLITAPSYAQELCVNCCPKKPAKSIKKARTKHKEAPTQRQEQSTIVNVPVSVTVEKERKHISPPSPPPHRDFKLGIHAGYGRTGLKLGDSAAGSATISQDRGAIGGGYVGTRVYKDFWISGNALSNGDVFGSVGLEF
jgi:hypothetical protein